MSTGDKPKSLKLQKVSMNLTERDVENAAFLMERLNERTQANIVSKSMSLTRDIVQMLEDGSKLLVKDKDGNLTEIKIIGL